MPTVTEIPTATPTETEISSATATSEPQYPTLGIDFQWSAYYAILGQPITYTTTLYNFGETTLSGISGSYRLTGPFDDASCTLSGAPLAIPFTLAPGQSAVCVAEHLVVDADVMTPYLYSNITIEIPGYVTNVREVRHPTIGGVAITYSYESSKSATGTAVLGEEIFFTATISSVGIFPINGITRFDPYEASYTCEVDGVAVVISSSNPVTLAANDNQPGGPDQLICLIPRMITAQDAADGAIAGYFQLDSPFGTAGISSDVISIVESTQTPTPEPSVSPSPTNTPELTPTETPSPTITPDQTPTATPTFEPQPGPVFGRFSVDKTTASLGETITYTIALFNSHTGSKSDISPVDNFGFYDCTGGTHPLNDEVYLAADDHLPGGTDEGVCTTTYVVTAADVLAGSVTNQVHFYGDTHDAVYLQPIVVSILATTPTVDPSATVTPTPTGSPAPLTSPLGTSLGGTIYVGLGEVITYELQIDNYGEVPDSGISGYDDRTGHLDDSACLVNGAPVTVPFTKAPYDSTDGGPDEAFCTILYTVVDADMYGVYIYNQAHVTAPGYLTVHTNRPYSYTVGGAHISYPYTSSLVSQGWALVGDSVTFTALITSTGPYPYNGITSVETNYGLPHICSIDGVPVSFSVSSPLTLSANDNQSGGPDELVCVTVPYTVTSDDLFEGVVAGNLDIHTTFGSFSIQSDYIEIRE